MPDNARFSPDVVLDFWFPDTGHWDTPEAHIAFWDERMQGGMDKRICDAFGPLAEAAADGALDRWAAGRPRTKRRTSPQGGFPTSARRATSRQVEGRRAGR